MNPKWGEIIPKNTLKMGRGSHQDAFRGEQLLYAWLVAERIGGGEDAHAVPAQRHKCARNAP